MKNKKFLGLLNFRQTKTAQKSMQKSECKTIGLRSLILLLSSLVALQSCTLSYVSKHAEESSADKSTAEERNADKSPFNHLQELGNPAQILLGKWLLEQSGEVMLDPQTSGLKYHKGLLYSLSDASADESQTKRLHQISTAVTKEQNTQSDWEASIIQKIGPTIIHSRVQDSCFFDYLNDQPDYEALVPVEDELASDDADSTWIWVTEDASRSKPLSAVCQTKYAKTGSTDYPTLLVRLEVRGEQLHLTHVKPVQFPTKSSLLGAGSADQTTAADVGNFPNDGIEGLAITKENMLLLGLEKDAAGQPRVFSVEGVTRASFWRNTDFVLAKDSELLLPKFASGNHPINGMDVYYPNPSSSGYLLAAARNDNELWIIDLAKQKPTKRISLVFQAPKVGTAPACAAYAVMNNASIEGVAVVGNDVWMVNDPWKVNYLKNAVCESDKATYEKMAPLLFKMSLSGL